MDKYSIEIVTKAEKEFLKLPETARNRVREKILLLENNPRPFGSKKFRETKYYRIRIGNFRVIYSIHDNNKIVKFYPLLIEKMFIDKIETGYLKEKIECQLKRQ